MSKINVSRNQWIGAAIVVVVIVVVIVIALSSGTSPKKNTSSTTTTAAVMTHTTAQQAVIASLSVARQALYVPASAKAQVSAHDISVAALPDKGTLIVLKNLGDITGSPSVVAFQWNFGSAPILTCVNEPSTRSGTPKVVKCPSGIKEVTTTTAPRTATKKK